MRPTSRAGLGIVALLCSLAAPALADEPAAVPQAQARAPKPPKHPKKLQTPGARKAAQHSVDPAAASLIGPAGAPPRQDAGAPGVSAAGQDAWSLNPKWSARNSGSSAPYGTRALINELGTNPSETTGYGAGAEMQFHF